MAAQSHPRRHVPAKVPCWREGIGKIAERKVNPVVWLGLVLVTANLAAQDLAPWSTNRSPGDVERKHIESITGNQHAYQIIQGGTLDGWNCRSPVGVYEAWSQSWESNRLVRMENVGDTNVVNPWLSNGRNGFRTPREIIDSAVRPGMNDREKALAIYAQEIQFRYHWHGDNDELGDPVKVFNVYGYNTCGNDSVCLAGLWNRAGIAVRGACVVGHCISQAYFDGRWNLLDGDTQGLYLLRDGYTIAGEADVARDHDLVKRTHTLGLLRRAGRRDDEIQASLFVLEGGDRSSRDSAARHTMNMTLRPGEAIVWRWGHLTPVKVHAREGIKFADTVCNGRWEYRPDFSRELWRQGAERVDHIRSTPDGLAAMEGQTGTIEWLMRSPYPVLGGQLEVDGSGAVWEVSFDGKTWVKTDANLDSVFPASDPARYDYRLRCTLTGDSRLRSLGIGNDLQMAALALPAMGVGENRFVYTDANTGPRAVRISHKWVERATTRPPAAPAAAVAPADGGKSTGTRIAFEWTPAREPDGDAIADYQFQLSDRADLAYPLSSNFNRLVTKAEGGAGARFALPRAGLLAPGRTYYWRVRAQDSHGVWGPWSAVWSFTATGPAVPLEARIELDEKRGVGVLKWTANAAGSRPVKYRVYGNDEKGFSASDDSYTTLGGGKELFPANFVAETTHSELTVLGRGLSLPNANRAYYRVVAVDVDGNWSADSDSAAAPRPFIFSQALAAAQVGREFRHTISTVRSVGDVRARDASKLETRYWDAERPTFAIEEGPDWLKVNATTGELSGTPTAPARIRVRVSATLEVDDRRLDEKVLAWGHEKVLGTSVKTLGKAVDEFVLDVQPAK